MWKELLETLPGDCEFREPVAVAQLDDAEIQLDVKLPQDLRSVLRESNGVCGEYGLRLVWPAERIVEDNLMFRTHPDFPSLYMPFDSLLFFADAGNGDQFAFAVCADGVIHGPDVFVWNHENDSRTCVAPNLKSYFEWWLTGRLKI